LALILGKELKEKFIDITYHQLKARDVKALKESIPGNFIWMSHCAQNFEWISYKFAFFTEAVKESNYRLFIRDETINKTTLPFALHKRIKDENPDFVLVHGINNYFQLLHLRRALGKRVKILVQHHGEQPRGILKRSLLKMSALVVDV
jgi:hypothetical protein